VRSPCLYYSLVSLQSEITPLLSNRRFLKANVFLIGCRIVGVCLALPSCTANHCENSNLRKTNATLVRVQSLPGTYLWNSADVSSKRKTVPFDSVKDTEAESWRAGLSFCTRCAFRLSKKLLDGVSPKLFRPFVAVDLKKYRLPRPWQSCITMLGFIIARVSVFFVAYSKVVIRFSRCEGRLSRFCWNNFTVMKLIMQKHCGCRMPTVPKLISRNGVSVLRQSEHLHSHGHRRWKTRSWVLYIKTCSCNDILRLDILLITSLLKHGLEKSLF